MPTGPICLYCKKPGHVFSKCLTLRRKRGEKRALSYALVNSFTGMSIEFSSSESFCPYDARKAKSSFLLREKFFPFVIEGLVSPRKYSAPQPIGILLNTGASQSLLLKEALPSYESEDNAIVDFCAGY